MRQQSRRPSSRPRNASVLARVGIGLVCLIASFGQVALAADGDPDTTFSADGMRQVTFAGSYTDEDSVQVGSDANGNIFVATKYRSANIPGFTVLKIRPNGDNDATFGFGGYASVAFASATGIDTLYGIFPQPDGSVMLVGDAFGFAIPDYYPVMAKLTSNGNNDSSFGDGGRLAITQTPWVDPSLFIEAATRQADGKFLFVGQCNCTGNNQRFLLRTSANGAPDPSFGSNGWAVVVRPSFSRIYAMSVDRAGRAVLVGSSGGQLLVSRVTAGGALDTSFGTAGTGNVLIDLLANTYANAIEIDSNDAIVVALSGLNSVTQDFQNGLVRLLPNGDRDMSYAGGFRDLSLEFASQITSLKRRSDGRMVAAGWIDHTGDPGFLGRDFLIARVLPNGSLDNSFDGNGLRRIALSSTRDTGEAMVLSAGKPVIAGISEANGVKQLGVLRMQSNLIFSEAFQ